MSFRQVCAWLVGALTVSLLVGWAPGDLSSPELPSLDDSAGDSGEASGDASGDGGTVEDTLVGDNDLELTEGDRALEPVDREAFPYGTDLAFEGDLVVAGSGNWDGPEHSGARLYRRHRDGTLDALSFLHCPSWHADVDFVPDTPDGAEQPGAKPSYAVMSHDSAEKNKCGPHAGKTGVGVVDVTNPHQPTVRGFAETVHGAHNLTTVGDEGIVYVSSYALGNPTAKSGVSVVDVEADPSNPPVTFLEFPTLDASGEHAQLGNEDETPPTSPGCHDITLDLDRDRAFCAGITETQIWDIRNPREPVIVEIIRNPAINIDHGAATNTAGDVLVINDEWAGASGGPTGCLTPRGPAGALWFYDISNPRQAQLRGHWSPSEPAPTADFCTSHFFGTFKDDAGKDLVVASWYDHGLRVLDFSDPAMAREVASFQPEGATFWAAYPYKGTLYANSFAPASFYGTQPGQIEGSDPSEGDAGGVWALDLEGYTADGPPSSRGSAAPEGSPDSVGQ